MLEVGTCLQGGREGFFGFVFSNFLGGGSLVAHKCLHACSHVCSLLTFKYVSPLTSYRNWQSVLFRMAIVELLMWILRAGNTNQISEILPMWKSDMTMSVSLRL